jgi:hypothetical protein
LSWRHGDCAAFSREHHGTMKWCWPQNFGFASAKRTGAVVRAEIGTAALSVPLAFLEQGALSQQRQSMVAEA